MDVYDDTSEADGHAPKRSRHWSTQVHKSAEYIALRAQFKAECRTTRNPDGSYGLPCARCHDKIDYRLSYPHPKSFTLDHIIPASERPDLALNPGNFRPSHKICNAERGTRHVDDEDDLDLGELSEDW
jgi:5-methylcytosine-specific restriction endonuclease McrA